MWEVDVGGGNKVGDLRLTPFQASTWQLGIKNEKPQKTWKELVVSQDDHDMKYKSSFV